MEEGEDVREIMERQKEEIDRLKQALAGVGNGTELEQKYLEALRKAKAINVKYESEKTKAEKLARRVLEIETKGLAVVNQAPVSVQPPVSDSGSGEVSPGKMKEKMANLQKTNAELKRANAALKGDVAKMKEIFKKETGLETFEPTEEGWRGRAQKISLLQAKLKDANRAASSNPTIAPSDSASVASTPYCGTAATKDYDDANRRAISEVSAARRAKETELTEKLKTLQSQLSESNSKNTGYSARITSLEAEVANLKINLQRVITKTENDDILVEAYKRELEKWKEGRDEAEAAETPCQIQSPVVGGKVKEEYEEMLDKKDAIIDSLTAIVKKMENGGSREGCESEYVLLLKSQLAAERDRSHEFEQALLSERQKHTELLCKTGNPPAIPAPFDTKTLPPPVIEHLAMLKGEVTSLKERLHIMKANHAAELSVLTAELQSSPQRIDTDGDDEREEDPDLKQEHEDLKIQYRELKMAFNKMMQQQQQQQQNT